MTGSKTPQKLRDTHLPRFRDVFRVTIGHSLGLTAAPHSAISYAITAIDPEQFVATAGRMLRQFGSAIGTPAHVTDLCVARQARYLRGMGAARALFEMRAA